MGYLVRNDVIDKSRRHLHQAPIDTDRAPAAATAPTALLAADLDTARTATDASAGLENPTFDIIAGTDIFRPDSNDRFSIRDEVIVL